jgi:hypothetical protein
VNTKDWNGFVPDVESLTGVDSFDEQLAKTRATFASTQAELMSNVVQIAYELGRLRGIVEERNRERM